jgi:predicted RNA-binding Zn-ribbon protein involved in translation (DUF1610 family)
MGFMNDFDHKLLIRGRLNGSQRNKLKGLFNMLYTPRELSEEIGINLEKIYCVYIPSGCPISKDHRGRISINGIEFRNWYELTYKKRKLEKDQAYCVSCKRIISIINPEIHREGNIIYYMSICPNCGNKATRFIDCKRKKNDQ